MTPPVISAVRSPFRAIAETIVPECQALTEMQWEELEGLVEGMLSTREAAVRKQIPILIRLINIMPVFLFGRTLVSLDRARRHRVLLGLQNTRVAKLRTGFWGLRTLVFLGFYGRDEARAAIGYAAHPDGWEATDD